MRHGVDSNPRFGVVVPAHNRLASTIACLEALFRSSQRPETIVVVDDGSTDGSAEVLAARYPEVRVLRGAGDLWWAGATNLGVRECLALGCEYVLLLNQDCEVEREAIRELMRVAEKHPDALVAAVNVNREDPDEVLWMGTRFSRPSSVCFGVCRPNRVTPPAAGRADLAGGVIETDLSGGRGLLIPAAVFKAIGLFDSRRCPQYGADTEFCLRARNNGYSILVALTAFVRVGMNESIILEGAGATGFVSRLFSLLFDLRRGQACYVWFFICMRHLPLGCAVPTYVRMLGVTVKRAWQERRGRVERQEAE